MVGKDEDLSSPSSPSPPSSPLSTDIDVENLARVKLIADKKRQLDLAAEQVCHEIKDSFARLHDALAQRERQMLRQVEVVHRQQLSLVQSNWELLPADSMLSAQLSQESELIQRLLDFGKIDLSNSIAINEHDPYKAEEYQEASEDFVSFDKSLKSEADEFDVSSVIRKKRDSFGRSSKNISINLNPMNFEPRRSAAIDVIPSVIAITPKKVIKNTFTDRINEHQVSGQKLQVVSNGDNGVADANDDDDKVPVLLDVVDGSPESFIATVNENTEVNEMNLAAISETKTSILPNYDTIDDLNSSIDKINSPENQVTAKTRQIRAKSNDIGDEYPIPIQQWLRQILAETETEPIIHEIGQFSTISNARSYRDFPLET